MLTRAPRGRISLSKIADILSGFARSGVRNDALFEVACREIARQTPSVGTLGDMASILMALSKLNYAHPLLTEIMSKRIALIAPFEKESKDLVKIVLAVSDSKKIKNKQLLSLLSAEICKRMDQLPPFAIAEVLHAYTQSGITNNFLVEVGIDESWKRKDEFQIAHVPLLLHGLSRVEGAILSEGASSKIKGIFSYHVDVLVRRGVKKVETLDSLTMLASSVAKHRGNENILAEAHLEKLFISIGDSVAEKAAGLEPIHVSGLLAAFARVGVQHGPLLYHMPSHVALLKDLFSLPEISAVVKAYSDLDIRNPTIMDVAPERIVALLQDPKWGPVSRLDNADSDSLDNPRIVSDIEVQALVNIVNSYAKLLVNEKSMLELVSQKIRENGQAITDARTMQQLSRSMSILGIPASLRLTSGEHLHAPSGANQLDTGLV